MSPTMNTPTIATPDVKTKGKYRYEEHTYCEGSTCHSPECYSGQGKVTRYSIEAGHTCHIAARGFSSSVDSFDEDDNEVRMFLNLAVRAGISLKDAVDVLNTGGTLPRPGKVTTQKGRGIKYIMNNSITRVSKSDGWSTNVGFVACPSHMFFPAKSRWTMKRLHRLGLKFPLFVRPCPTVPRHGFVDSRVVYSLEQLKDVFTESKLVEPDCEIAITKPIKAKTSGILAGSVVTIGGGTDGATSGREGCVEFPVVRSSIPRPPESVVKGDEGDFWEFLVDDRKVLHLVQVRSGPNIEGLKASFIPRDTVVKEVLTTQGDLLEWETKIANAEEGTVVHGPPGSISSHYGVHCVINKVPYLTGVVPLVGEELEQNTDVDFEPDVEGLKRGYALGLQMKPKGDHECSSYKNDWANWADKIVITAIGIVHNTPAIITSPRPLEEIGMLLGALVRVGTAYCSGESRHEHGLGNGGNRERVYVRAGVMESDDLLEELARADISFNWGNFDDGYGGEAWAKCSGHVLDLHNSMANGNLRGVFEALNNIVHESHNNGLFLTKCTSPSEFNLGADSPDLWALLRASTLLEVVNTMRKDKSQLVQSRKVSPVDPSSYRYFIDEYDEDLREQWSEDRSTLLKLTSAESLENMAKRLKDEYEIHPSYLKKVEKTVSLMEVRIVRAIRNREIRKRIIEIALQFERDDVLGFLRDNELKSLLDEGNHDYLDNNFGSVDLNYQISLHFLPSAKCHVSWDGYSTSIRAQFPWGYPSVLGRCLIPKSDRDGYTYSTYRTVNMTDEEFAKQFTTAPAGAETKLAYDSRGLYIPGDNYRCAVVVLDHEDIVSEVRNSNRFTSCSAEGAILDYLNNAVWKVRRQDYREKHPEQYVAKTLVPWPQIKSRTAADLS